MTLLLRKPAVRNISRKTWNLRNFPFYKFSEDLSFQPLQKDWAILQQFVIPWYHYNDTASQKACSQGSWVGNLFRETFNFRNFAFCKFSEDLGFQPSRKHWVHLQQFVIPCITTMTQLLRKPGVRAAESGIYSGKLVICEILHFTNFNINLVYFPWI